MSSSGGPRRQARASAGGSGRGAWRVIAAVPPGRSVAAHDGSSVASARAISAIEPALAHDEHAVGHAEHLGQLGGDHQDGHALGRPARDMSRWTSALAPTSMPRVGSSRISSCGSVASHLPMHDLLLVAAATACRRRRVERVRYLTCSRSAQRPRGAALGRESRSPSRRSDAQDGQGDVVLRPTARMTRPCWRRSSGTKRDAGAHRRGGACRRARRRPSSRTRAGVVPVDAEDRPRDLGAAGAHQAGEADDLAGAHRRS